MISKRPNTLEELLRLDDASKAHWLGVLLDTPPPLQPPELKQWSYKMMAEHFELTRKPPSTLSPAMQALQRSILGVIPPHMQRLSVPFEQLRRTNHLADVLETCPPLKQLQWEMNAVLDNNNEGLSIDTPALLDAIARHLGRPQRFTRIKELTPTVQELIGSLRDLYTRKPKTHQAVMQFLVRASLYQQAPHPKRCSCPLCTHMVYCSSNPSPKSRTDTFRTEPEEGPAHASRNGRPVCRCCHVNPVF